MKAPHFLGVDVGGTKTHALVVDESGQAVGFGLAGPGNPEWAGYSLLEQALKAAVPAALAMAGVKQAAIAGAGFGVAGYDWPGDCRPTLAAIESLGLSCPFEAVNDTVIGLLAGVSQGWGVAVVAGTGNNCRGRDRQGREGRVTGEGIQFGEFAGASELVWKAVHAISHAWIRRGPPTQLSQAFVEKAGAHDTFELLEWIARDRAGLDPGWARLVFETAYAGDPVAQDVIAWAGRELGELACAVIRQLDLAGEAVEVVQVGSLFKGGPLLTGPMQATVQSLAPKAHLVPLTAPPVVGGVLLGMEAAGINGYPLRSRLIETTRLLTMQQENSK